MKRSLSIVLALCFSVLSFGLQAQSLEELKAQKEQLKSEQAAEQAEADAYDARLSELAAQIEKLSGWQTGLNGLLGLSFNTSNNWQANANRNSASSILNVGVSAFANNIKEKSFWRNTLNVNVSWQGLDNDTKDDVDGGDFLESRNGDVLILTSLYGYRLNSEIALSGLGDLNTSVFNFLDPGTASLGLGATWTPSAVPNLVVVVHPLTYQFAFSGLDGVDSQGAVGAKLRATYSTDIVKGLNWTSNLGAFLPYSNEEFPITYLNEDNAEVMDEAGLVEWTWINTFNVADIWKGIGVGFTVGLRQADFEYPEGLQSYTALGFTYGF
ncbi:hypothetical protein CEQ90_07030 [Lewinellaceae bacterium SD302]|nr:hypothetical protein CEQ90_07030 [Lewinellaceae bacterium SD302]